MRGGPGQTQCMRFSFSFPFQVALNRAWSRCVHIATRELEGSVGTSRHTSSARSRQIINRQALQRHSVPLVIDISPDNLSKEEIDSVDPSRAEIGDSWQDHTLDGVTVAATVASSNRRTAKLLPPRSKKALYQNLLHSIILHDPAPRLPSLVDYHDLYPSLQSTRSYNTLINMALRHTCHRTAQRLLESMRAKGIQPNVQTLRLRVRCLVQAGRFTGAVRLVKGTEYKTTQQKQSLIWLELCRQRRGRKKTFVDRLNKDQSPVKPVSSGTTRYSLQYRLSTKLKSSITPEMLPEMPPRPVYYMIRLLLQAGDTSAACSMTNTYLSNLPRPIPRRWALPCLHILHLHIRYRSSDSKGLARFFKMRRMLFDFLKHHDWIQPTSTTLLLLLAPLRRAKRCGTFAWKFLNSFKPELRRKIVDSRVRRRVIMLADKEGRTDIIKKMLAQEQSFMFARHVWRMEREVLGGKESLP